MSYSIAQLKVDLQGRIHGTSLSKVQGIYELISRAGRQLLLDADPIETMRVERVQSTFYDDIYDHPAPEDLKGDKLIDFRPIRDRDISTSPDLAYSRDFDRRKGIDPNLLTIEYNKGKKYLRVSKNFDSPSALID